MSWTPKQATACLLERGMFGMQPGLGRIKALLAGLGDPHLSFRPIHIVGTNGKSSTARFAAHLAARRGFTAGAYVSPHLVGFEERVLLPVAGGLGEVPADVFAATVGDVMAAVEVVESAFGDGDRITQFEIVTAAAFELFRRSGVEVAAIEAGMGGRFDATNVLGAGVVALSSVGLDHTEWLGDDLASIAGEKLAVVKPGDRLVVADGLDPSVQAEVDAAVARSGHGLTVAPAVPEVGVVPLARGSFQLRNLALAEAAIALLAGGTDADALNAVARDVSVPGRMNRIAVEPDTWVDAAHNPEGIGALASELTELAAGREIVCLLGVLADKDHGAMSAALLGRIGHVIATEPENPRALPAESLAESLRAAGHGSVSVNANPRAALAQARGLAGPDGVVIATGSVHLVGDLLSSPGERTVTAL